MADTATLKIPRQLDRLRRDLADEARGDITIRAAKVIARYSELGAAEAAATRLYNDRTGLTRRTTTPISVRIRGDVVRGGFGTEAPYARFVHDGTATIAPRPWGTNALRAIRRPLTAALTDALTPDLL